MAIWDAMRRRRDHPRRSGSRRSSPASARATNLGPMLACLEVACRHRGFLQRMLPSPYRSLDAKAAARVVIEAIEAAGILPVD